MESHYKYLINNIKEKKDPESRKETIADIVKQICGTHGKPTDILNVDNEDDAAAFRRLAPQKICAKR